jgi:hypothetical protein
MVRQGQVVLADRVASFGAAGQQWDIEVLGWTAAHRSLLRDGVTVLQEIEGAAVLRCEAGDKQALLRMLIAAPLEIGSVQPMRAASLEETYLKHAGAV